MTSALLKGYDRAGFNTLPVLPQALEGVAKQFQEGLAVEE
jgi:hypothetical protein